MQAKTCFLYLYIFAVKNLLFRFIIFSTRHLKKGPYFEVLIETLTLSPLNAPFKKLFFIKNFSSASSSITKPLPLFKIFNSPSILSYFLEYFILSNFDNMGIKKFFLRIQLVLKLSYHK